MNPILLNGRIIPQLDTAKLQAIGNTLLCILTDWRQVVTVGTFNAAFILYPMVEAELTKRV